MIPTSTSPSSPNADDTFVSPAGSPTLTALKHVVVTPEGRITNAPAKMLQNIEHINVAKAAQLEDAVGKNQLYIISVYMAHKTKDLPPSREPDFQVLHSVGQFCSLRNNVHACVQRSHQGARCKFCEQLARFVTFGEGEALAFAAMAFSPKADASRLLNGFLHETLRQSQLALETMQSSGCRGQHKLPRLLQTFILQSPQH